MRTHPKPAQFTATHLLEFEAREHEYLGWREDSAGNITHQWRFDSKRTGMRCSRLLETIEANCLRVTMNKETGAFICFERWNDD
jgi:hypothetical protein